ncbi:Tho complex subunit 7-domain-containing protein [Neohortaea acidophila]|uniref:Tho complex subunit 7-domain-containing protein n=1 Tax=Neohortaea acidophila TaxID=245834 RepID=A0A6A6Q3K4_9PEZI|nr:Tho complex subunit 7-domain-containing protein [Neohortaea acidophila]KAF2487028.1 Tho complex subunit 7-domain-containing protein [Neohortaea acidophila]
MSAHAYTFLPEQAQEDALHAARLLAIEERPFQRVTSHLLGKDSLLQWTPPTQLPSPPPEGEASEAPDATATDNAAKRQRIHDDVLLDFAVLENSIRRIQLLQSSNAKERQRYAAEKAKIVETAQAVKNNTLGLRTQLAEAQRMLELRKGYDELAAKLITPKLKARAETTEDIVKLEKEIEDLQQESADYDGTWVGRREAFDRVVAEGQAMMRVIKGIKDEPEPETEKDETMDDGEEGAATAKGGRSRLGTPGPDIGGRTPMQGTDLGGRTPMPGSAELGGGTPMRGDETPFPETGDGTPRPSNKMLDVDEELRSSSLAGSPMLQAQEGDVDMEETPAAISTMAEDAQAEEEQVDGTASAAATSEQAVATPAEEMEVE